MKRDTFSMTKAVRNEQLVRELDRKRHRELFMVVLTALVLTVAVIVYAWPHFEIIRLGYRMEELRERREKLLEEKHHLELQLATESDPERIEQIAREQLSMIYPDAEHLIVLESLPELNPESGADAAPVLPPPQPPSPPTTPEPPPSEELEP